MSKVSDVVSAVAGAVWSVTKVLPASWQARVNKATKAVAAAAASVAAAALAVAQYLPAQDTGVVAAVVGVATLVATYFAPANTTA